MIDLTPIAEPIQKRLFEKTQVLGRTEFPGQVVKNSAFTHSKLAMRSTFVRMASGLENPIILVGGELTYGTTDYDGFGVPGTETIAGGYFDIYGSRVIKKPKDYDFFDVKPFVGLEATSSSATYFLAGIYLDDNAGVLFTGESSKFLVTPSFGFGSYNAGSGKELGYTLEFRTTIEISYQFENKNRIGLSLGHISNADLGADNPGVEVISLSYQIPY